MVGDICLRRTFLAEETRPPHQISNDADKLVLARLDLCPQVLDRALEPLSHHGFPRIPSALMPLLRFQHEACRSDLLFAAYWSFGSSH
jgi:hypothetical protein